MDQLLYGRVFGLPVWVVGLVVIGGGIAVYLLFFRNRSASSSSGTLGQNSAGQQNAVPPVDQSLYDPFTGAPLAAETAINPATGLPNYYNSSGNGTTGPTPPGTSVTLGPGEIKGPPGTVRAGYKWVHQPDGGWLMVADPALQPGGGQTGGQQQPSFNVRGQDTTGQFAYWDVSHPQGVPIRPAPGSTTISSYDAYGSPIQIDPAGAVAAQYAGQGASLVWYPVAGGGYINGADVTGAPHGGAHGPYQGTPWWPVMMDMPVVRR